MGKTRRKNGRRPRRTIKKMNGGRRRRTIKKMNGGRRRRRTMKGGWPFSKKESYSVEEGNADIAPFLEKKRIEKEDEERRRKYRAEKEKKKNQWKDFKEKNKKLFHSEWNKYKENKKNRYRMEKFPEDQYTEFIKENGSNIKNLSEYYYGSDSDYGIEMCDKFRIDDGYWYDDISNNIFYFADDKEYQESGLITKCITLDEFIIDEIIKYKDEDEYFYTDGIGDRELRGIRSDFRIATINRAEIESKGRISIPGSEYDDY
jgi:hypothetical protein